MGDNERSVGSLWCCMEIRHILFLVRLRDLFEHGGDIFQNRKCKMQNNASRSVLLGLRRNSMVSS